MEVYKWLIINRVREYKRLLKNMWIQILGVCILFGALFYEVWKSYIPLVSEYPIVSWKLYCFFMGIICVFNLKKTIGKIKPQIVVKPMTLFLFSEKRIKEMVTFKWMYYCFKYIIISGLITICTVGLNKFEYQWKLTIIYFIALMGGALLSWMIYNTKKKNKKQIFQLYILVFTVLGLLSKEYFIALILDVFFLLILFLYVMLYLRIDYYKYNNDIVYLEKILVAQNFNNTVLLNQYAKEKISRSVSPINKQSRLLKNFPVMWKAAISISRLGKLGIGISIGAFVIPFCIYTIPFMWQIPVMESETARYILLMLGIYFCYQTSVQTFTRQLTDIMDKRKEGLYIPVDIKRIIVQFSIVPIIILFVMTGITAILLKSNIFFSIFFFLILSFYLVINLVFSIRFKKLFQKIYMILSMILLMCANMFFI